MRSVLVSTFGMFMLVVVLCSIGNNRLTSQLANVMPHAFGFSNTATSLLLGAAGLLNIPVIVLTGSWHAAPRPRPFHSPPLMFRRRGVDACRRDTRRPGSSLQFWCSCHRLVRRGLAAYPCGRIPTLRRVRRRRRAVMPVGYVCRLSRLTVT
jgi:hypothetical protein